MSLFTDAELIDVCRDFRHGMIGEGTPGDGFCAMVSWPLAAYLRACCGINADCVQTDLKDHPTAQCYEHVWIRLADGRVLDPTFDQFCSEEPVDIYLGAATEFHITPESTP